MSAYQDLGVKTLINGKGPATRLSGGIMRPEVIAAMTEASQYCVDIAELQAAASASIADLTGAEAGYVASGASAYLLLGAAADLLQGPYVIKKESREDRGSVVADKMFSLRQCDWPRQSQIGFVKSLRAG